MCAILISGCYNTATNDVQIKQFVSRCQELEIRATKRQRGNEVEVLIESIDALRRLPASDSIEMVVNIENVELDSNSLRKLVSSANITEISLVECVLSRGDIGYLMESNSINRLTVSNTSVQPASQNVSSELASKRRLCGRNLYYLELKNVDVGLANEILSVYGYPKKTHIEMPITYDLPYSSSLLDRSESLEVKGCRFASTMFDQDQDLVELTIVNSSIDAYTISQILHQS